MNPESDSKDRMKYFGHLICVCGMALAVHGQEPVTLTIESQPIGYEIPADFAGVSIFTGTQVRDHKGVAGNLFSGSNTQLITLFKNAGLRHLRLGATGSPKSASKNLSHEDIDALFAFAKATDIKVIYSLHFIEGPATAKYVWDNYGHYVDYFAFDNEPDSRLDEDNGTPATGPKDYFASWRDFADDVIKAAPDAKFAGPDAAGRTLVKRFVKSEKDSGYLALVTQHTYVGGNPIKRSIDLPHAIENMLSQEWVTNNYPQLYRTVLEPVQRQGLPFRLTELDDHVHGVTNASDAFVSALWALDCMHWWAAHGAAGVNFQNTEWLRTDTFYRDSDGNYKMHPKAYAIKAFDLGSHGRVQSVAITNKKELNLTAYAVADATILCVTIINKEHGVGGRDARVQILSPGLGSGTATVMYLTAGDGGIGATNGITLGGGTIVNNAPWEGKWAAIDSKKECVIPVRAASAAVVKISR
jgi:hypothetical protein